MESYEQIREQHKPNHIKILLVAESPPPNTDIKSSRHFYRADKLRSNDRLFINTIKALYPDPELKDQDIEQQKQYWLNKLQSDGIYMIEALETSLPHQVTKKERQNLIKNNLPKLIERIKNLTDPDTKIILIKSNVFEVAADALRQAGFNVINKALVDYPGQYNQKAYREKLASLLK